MLALERVSHLMLDREPNDISPPHTPTPPMSRFESLPTELRLQVYSLLLDGKPGCCFLEKYRIGRNCSLPKLHPAILAVNRSISAETYPILYGENIFLFLGTTKLGDILDARQQYLSRLAGLPNLQKPTLLPEQFRHLTKHVVAAPLELARHGWVGQLLRLAPAIKILDFDFWVFFNQRPRVLEPVARLSILNACASAIESLINPSTQTFRIGIRDISSYHDSKVRFLYRNRVDLPSEQLAVIDLKGLDNVQEKKRNVRKALQFILRIMGQRPPIPESTIASGQALVCAEKRLLLHKDFARFWLLDEATVQIESQGWVPLDADDQIVDIGSECMSITWRRSATGQVMNKALDSYKAW